MFLLVVGTKACEYNRLLLIGSGFKHVFFHPPGEMGEFDSHLTGCNWVCQPPLIIKDSQNNQHPSTSMLVDFDRFNVLVLPFSQLQPVSTGHVVFWHRCWLSVWRRNRWHCSGIWTKSLFTASQKKDSQMFQRVFFSDISLEGYITSKSYHCRVVKGGVPRGGGSLMFPKVPQSSLGILRVPQLPPPLEHPPP